MAFDRVRVILVAAAFALPACSFDDDSFWPSLSAQEPATARAAAKTPTQDRTTLASSKKQAAPVGALGQRPQPPLGSSDFTPPSISPGKPTGTFVGKKVIELRSELRKLQNSVARHNLGLQKLRAAMVQNSQRYHGTVAAVNARLQVGTTRGNPILVQQFNNAQGDLDRISGDITSMNRLATAIAADSTMSEFLSESTHAAFAVSGAVDEDHRQLAILEDEVNRTVVLVDRLLKEVSDDVRRQTNYVATERGNINLLSAGIRTGEIFGVSLTNRAMASAGGPVTAGRAGTVANGRRPLVVIRFDRTNVPYQQALYNAISRVLERRPNAVFDLVAVAPSAGGPARVALNANKSRRHAEGVLRALVDMGLPPSRVAVSAKTLAAAKTNEVHVYLR